MLFGRSQSNMPSRFLKEIPEDLMESHSGSKRQTIQPKAKPAQNVGLVSVQRHLKASHIFRLEGWRQSDT